MRSSAKAVGTPKASEAAISMVGNMRIGCILSFSCWRQNRRELIENVIRVRWVPMGILNLWMPYPERECSRISDARARVEQSDHCFGGSPTSLYGQTAGFLIRGPSCPKRLLEASHSVAHPCSQNLGRGRR